MSISRYVVIVAGGSGLRMGSDIPKQFINLKGKPILMHTIELFAMLEPKATIILVLPQQQMLKWNELCELHSFSYDLTLVPGGATRFQSVKNGLSVVPADESLVAIHDGVRPLVSKRVIENCFEEAALKGCAIPVVRPVESVRLEEGGTSRAYNRNSVLLVQTPQVFKSTLIKECYNAPEQPYFTDDASVVEYRGYPIHTVEGNRENIKITTPFDLLIAETLIGKKL